MARRLSRLAHLPVTELRGIGPERARALAGLGITSVLDLLTHYPRRHLDMTRQSSVRDAVLCASVLTRYRHGYRYRHRRRSEFVYNTTCETKLNGTAYCIEIAPPQWRGRMTALYNTSVQHLQI